MATTTAAAPTSASILQNNHSDNDSEGGDPLQWTPPSAIPAPPAGVAAVVATPQGQRSTKIHVLPPDVVARIAAGEAIQRPAQAIKELLENSLDARATEIRIQVVSGGLEALHVSDNGCGMDRTDLLLAATRHATSKLQSCSDLDALSTFGFRGEALASVSHVAHLLTITSRTAQSPLAYRVSYRGGIPVAPHPAPQPCARSLGTTIAIDDLFHTLPHRKASFRPSDEYQKILRVAQHYAIHVAQRGIGIVCESDNTNTSSSSRGNSKANHGSRGGVHLNTGSLPSVQRARMDRRSGNDKGSASGSSSATPSVSASAPAGDDDPPRKDSAALSSASFQATRDAIVHALGSDLRDALHPFVSCLGPLSSATALSIPASPPDNAGDTPTSSSAALTAPSYSCTGLVTDPNASSSSSTSGTTSKRISDFVLFINHRLVDCPPLQKAVEDAYRGSSSTSSSHGSGKPSFFAYLSLEVPPHHVDVNVHPTKRRVTLLHLDVVSNHLRDTLRDFLSRRGQSFCPRGAQPPESKATKLSTGKSKRGDTSTTATAPFASGSTPPAEADDAPARPSAVKRLRSSTGAPTPTQPPGSQRIRTSASTPAGALEPFLVPTQRSFGRGSTGSGTSNNGNDAAQQSSESDTQPATQESDTDPSQSVNPETMGEESDIGGPLSVQHEPSCPLALESNSAPTVDMTQPGAFAALASHCACRRPPPEDSTAVVGAAAAVVRLPRQAVPRPKRVAPTECRYTSVAQLRRRLQKRSSPALQAKLRASVWVGLASPHRSLLQCGEELVEVHHTRLAEHLFYQLALWRFAGADLARLEPPLNVEQLVVASVQLEERLGTGEEGLEESHGAASSIDGAPLSDTNQILARQVAACLLQNAEMLLEYFSIAIERDARTGTVLLTGLPVLLEGYAPSPQGLPLFLLRLATEVDWTDERPCFHGVCRELGTFYAQCCPTSNDGNGQSNGTSDALSHQVRHTLFPAVSTLLIPPKELELDETEFRVLTSLSKLYRVFERC